MLDRYWEIGSILDKPGCVGKYKIKDTIGRGASCAVYYADFVDENGICTEHLLKEYNPRGIQLMRDAAYKLQCYTEKDRSSFEAGLARFKQGYEMQLCVRRCTELRNSTSNIQGVFDAYGTCYIDLTVMSGTTYEKIEEKTLWDLLHRIRAIAMDVGNYHKQGLLHLDIKPENILILPETVDLVQMFDFDSVLPKENVLNAALLSYTKTWAAQEQILPNRRNRICEATDIFAIGEILFYKVMGRHSNRDERRSFSKFVFDYSSRLFEGVNPKVFPLLTEVFNHTICNVPEKRYQTTSELLTKLDETISLANPNDPFLQSSVPSQAAYFVGRDKELQEMDEKINKHGKLFISGMGGIGKSELVKQYIHTHERDYETIIFSVYNMDLRTTILDDEVFPICHVQRDGKKDQDYFREKFPILKRLCNPKVLIVIDNLDDFQDDFLPDFLKLNCKMLFTTRCDVEEYNYSQLKLGILQEEFIWDIFQTWHRTPLSSEEYAATKQIIALYQGHTMAVELIAKQMRASCVFPSQMLQKLNAGGLSETGRERVIHTKDGMNTKLNIHTHIKRLFDVSGLRDSQVYVLVNLSLIPPSGIARKQFYEWCSMESYDDINDLTESGWVKQDNDSDRISLHPLVADVMLGVLKEHFELCRKMVRTITTFLHKARPDNEEDSLYTDLTSFRYERTIPIVLYMAEKISTFENLPPLGIDLVLEAASNLHGFGSVSTYLSFTDRVYANYEKQLNQDSFIIIKLLNIRGILQSANCDYEMARESYTTALDLAEATYGEANEKTLAIKRNLMGLFHSLGMQKELKELYYQMRPLHTDHSEYDIPAIAYNQMGKFAKALGLFHDAEIFYNKALWQFIIDYGYSHGHTGTAHLNLGSLYCTLEKFEEAEEHLGQARQIFREYYGDIHENTATAYNNSGHLFLKQGKYKQAEMCFQKAYDIQKEIKGNTHSDLAISFGNLGSVYQKQGKMDLALEYYMNALSVMKALYGDNHINLASQLCQIGSLQMEMGQWEMSELNLLKAEQITQIHYGIHSTHPDVATINNALGNLYGRQGKFREAIKYCSEALHIWQCTYGDSHSHVGIAHLNLGVYYREAHRYEDAIRELESALHTFIKVHGNDRNLDTASVYSAMGKTYFAIERKKDAEYHYNKALEIRLSFLDLDHPAVKLLYQRLKELNGNN